MKGRRPKGREPQFAPKKTRGPGGPRPSVRRRSRGDERERPACLTYSGRVRGIAQVNMKYSSMKTVRGKQRHRERERIWPSASWTAWCHGDDRAAARASQHGQEPGGTLQTAGRDQSLEAQSTWLRCERVARRHATDRSTARWGRRSGANDGCATAAEGRCCASAMFDAAEQSRKSCRLADPPDHRSFDKSSLGESSADWLAIADSAGSAHVLVERRQCSARLTTRSSRVADLGLRASIPCRARRIASRVDRRRRRAPRADAGRGCRRRTSHAGSVRDTPDPCC